MGFNYKDSRLIDCSSNYSDIDLVVLGTWDPPPLWKLKDALVENNIAKEEYIKVLDKASVSTIFKTLCSKLYTI